MPKKGTHTQTGKAKTQGLYDRIADVHNLALRLNGYRNSVAKYLRSLDLLSLIHISEPTRPY